MNDLELIDFLLQRGATLSEHNGQLQVVAPTGVLTSSVLSELADRKPAILALLNSTKAGLDGSRFPQLTPSPLDRYDAFPLTDLQQAYWVAKSGGISGIKHSPHLYVELDSQIIEPARFQAAWNKLVERHDMLRSVCLPEGKQKVLRDVAEYNIRVQRFPGAEPSAVERHLEEWRDQMSHQIFELGKWPSFDIRLTQSDSFTRLHFSIDLSICDLSGRLQLFRELWLLYSDTDATLPSIEATFRDYVLAEALFQSTPTAQVCRAYWLNRVDSLPSAPELPLASNDPRAADGKFVRRSFRMDRENWTRLKALSSERGLTTSGLLVSAFSEVLALWSQTSSFTINVTLSNRLPLHPDVDKIVGDFTSVTLLAIDRDPQGSFEQHSKVTQQQLWNDLEHRHFSGVRVLREIARRRGGEPVAIPIVFTSALALGSTVLNGSPLSNFGQLVFGITQTPQVWLDNQVSERAGCLVINWDTQDSLFPDGLIDEMFDTYCDLLVLLSNDPKAWSTRSPARHAVSTPQIETPSFSPRDLLHSSLDRQAVERPHAPAVIGNGRTLSYRELSGAANALAWDLLDRGCRPNKLVAVVMKPGWEQIVAVLGVLRAGAAYLPIDPDLPTFRREYMMKHGEALVALTQPELARRLEWPPEIDVVVVDSGFESTAPLESPPVRTTPDDLAYVIFTSGSSGLPKGVAISHSSVVNTIEDINRRFEVGCSDRVMGVSALSFDLSVWDIFGVLGAGGTLVLLEAGRERDPAHWIEQAAAHRVTIWNSVPALARLLIDYIDLTRISAPNDIRLVMLSGDWIPVDLPTRIKAHWPASLICSLGGATEASIWSIMYLIDEVKPGWSSIPYGRPLSKQAVTVFDSAMEVCPTWAVGEIYIGGLGLAREYWRDRDKSNASFVHHPNTGDRWYRTGDLGRYLPDGNIEFLGRRDTQVKINGFRIELEEIAATARQYNRVRQCIAAVSGVEKGIQSLICYVVPAEPSRDTADQRSLFHELKSFLEERLPSYMVPNVYVPLSELPLSANGKIDRRMLPSPRSVLDCTHTVDPRAPVSELAAKLTRMIRRILQIDSVGASDDFFQLGGNSVHIILLRTELKAELGVDVPTVELFRRTTITQLSDYLLENTHALVSGDVRSSSELGY